MARQVTRPQARRQSPWTMAPVRPLSRQKVRIPMAKREENIWDGAEVGGQERQQDQGGHDGPPDFDVAVLQEGKEQTDGQVILGFQGQRPINLHQPRAVQHVIQIEKMRPPVGPRPGRHGGSALWKRNGTSIAPTETR